MPGGIDGEAENVRHEFRRGVAACPPVCVSVAVYGIAFGVPAARAGPDVRTVAFMSASVYAGAPQFAAPQFWRAPLAAGTIVFAVLVINLRLILITASLAATFRNVARGKALPAMFLTADGNRALTMAEAGRGRAGPAFFAGTGLILYPGWVRSTVAGAALGSAIPIDPASCGIGFVFTAVPTAPIVGMWRGKRDPPDMSPSRRGGAHRARTFRTAAIAEPAARGLATSSGECDWVTPRTMLSGGVIAGRQPIR